jgi:hypothetical protein
MMEAAAAKEHTAGCPDLVSMIGRVKASLDAAIGQRLRGSSLAAYQVLRYTAASLVRDSGDQRCGALGPTMTSALRRAATSRTALDASVELDLGLAAALSLATEGRMPVFSSPPKLPPVAEATLYGQDCPDLFPLTVRLEGPPPELPGRVASVLADLRARPRCARIRTLLESTPAERMAHAVDSIRLDEPDAPASTAALEPLTRCPELPVIVERLGAAIDIGAPLYNSGDHEGCRRGYEAVARGITADIIGEGRCPAVRSLLDAGVAGAGRARTQSEAAWSLRRSFDAILSGKPGAAP